MKARNSHLSSLFLSTDSISCFCVAKTPLQLLITECIDLVFSACSQSLKTASVQRPDGAGLCILKVLTLSCHSLCDFLQTTGHSYPLDCSWVRPAKVLSVRSNSRRKGSSGYSFPPSLPHGRVSFLPWFVSGLCI